MTMYEGSIWLSALMMGLLGSGHCAGMCGGIAGALDFAIESKGNGRKVSAASHFLTHGVYSLGRVSSYMVAGALAGGLGYLLPRDPEMAHALRSAAGIFMILIGLYIAGIANFLVGLERVGQLVWGRLSPLTRKLVPVTNLRQALLLGLLWGWLPCGLVYSALVLALGAGNSLNGAIVMLMFGLGTAPAVVSLGLMSARIRSLFQQRTVRLAAGLLMIGFGLWTIFMMPVAHSLMPGHQMQEHQMQGGALNNDVMPMGQMPKMEHQ